MKLVRLLKKYIGVKHYMLACVILLLLCIFKLSTYSATYQLETEINRQKEVFEVTLKQLSQDEGLQEKEEEEIKHLPYDDSLLKDRGKSHQIQTIKAAEYKTIENPILYEDVRPGVIKLTPAGRKSIEKEIHVLSMQDSHRERLSKIRHNCQNITDARVDLSGIIYNDKHKYIMCSVPKAACISWKRFWWHLAGYGGYKTVSGDKLVLNHGYITTLNEIPVSEALTKLKKYTTFFIKRNPLERLVSAHSSKFTSRYKEDGYKKRLGITAAKKYLPNFIHNIQIRNYVGTDFENKLNQSSMYQSLPQEKQNEVRLSVIALNIGEINFDIFTKMVIGEYEKGKPGDIDVHWRNQVDLCSPCTINYDYIIDFNHLHEESNRLLDYLQQGDQEKDKVFFGSRKNRIDSNTTYGKLHSLPQETRVKLLKLYKRDLDVFNFSDLDL